MARGQAGKTSGMESGGSVEGFVEGFAEDLGKLLGQAQNKAEDWLGQRTQIVQHLEGIRDTAVNLLNQLGHVPGKAAGSAKRGYRATARSSAAEFAANVKSSARTMSEEARKAISDAQKRRWAKWRRRAKG